MITKDSYGTYKPLVQEQSESEKRGLLSKVHWKVLLLFCAFLVAFSLHRNAYAMSEESRVGPGEYTTNIFGKVVNNWAKDSHKNLVLEPGGAFEKKDTVELALDCGTAGFQGFVEGRETGEPPRGDLFKYEELNSQNLAKLEEYRELRRDLIEAMPPRIPYCIRYGVAGFTAANMMGEEGELKKVSVDQAMVDISKNVGHLAGAVAKNGCGAIRAQPAANAPPPAPAPACTVEPCAPNMPVTPAIFPIFGNFYKLHKTSGARPAQKAWDKYLGADKQEFADAFYYVFTNYRLFEFDHYMCEKTIMECYKGAQCAPSASQETEGDKKECESYKVMCCGKEGKVVDHSGHCGCNIE